MMIAMVEQANEAYKFRSAYLSYNGKRIDAGTVQDFEFIPDPDSGELRSVQWRELLTDSFTFTVTCDWDMSSADDFWEELYPELRWQSFEQAIDRMLKWLWW